MKIIATICIKMMLAMLSIGILCGSCRQKQAGKEQAAADNNWKTTGPGGGGSIFIPTFSYHSPETFILRCDMGGSYLSRNGGQSYQQINLPKGASCYAFDPLDSATLYIGSTFLNRTSDGGRTWERIFPLAKDVIREYHEDDHGTYRIETSDRSLYEDRSNRISCIRADPDRRGGLYMGMGSSFLYSSDSGQTWKKKTLDHSLSYIYTGDKASGGQIFLFTSHAVYRFDKTTESLSKHDLPEAMVPAFSFAAGTVRGSGELIFYALHHDIHQEIHEEFGYTEVWSSESGGDGWKRMEGPVVSNARSGSRPSYSMISCAERDAGVAYLITNRYEEKKGEKTVYWYGALKTSDKGSRWDWVWKGGGGSGQYGVKDGTGPSNLSDAWVDEAFGQEYIRLIDVGVSPDRSDIAIITDWYRTMKTIDGGRTWEQIYSDPQPDGSYGSRGFEVTTTYGVHFDPFDDHHIAISYTDIGFHHSSNGGDTWKRSVKGVPREWVNTCYWMVFDPDVKGRLWSAWSYMHDIPRGKMTRNPQWKEVTPGGICVSDDGGNSWQPCTAGMGLNSPTTSIVLDPRSSPGQRTLYATVYNKGVVKSTDDGKTWQLKNQGIDGNTCAFEITLAANGHLYLTVSAAPMHRDGKKGRDYYSGAVYKSVDGAESWTKLHIYDGPIFPNGVEVDPDDPNRIYLACWSSIALSDLVGGDVARSTGGNERIDTRGGIYLSEDGGQTWSSIFGSENYVYDVTADPRHKDRFYCTTFNDAAYRSDDRGRTWEKIKGYDFHQGHRVMADIHHPDKVYITTFGSSVWHGIPFVEK